MPKQKSEKEEVSIPNYQVNEMTATLSQSLDWGMKYCNIPESWKISKGKGISIVVIDTGKPNHNDIGDNAIAGVNLVSGEGIEDLNGHQTHCVGIICAKDNNPGYVGVAPESRCICIKALNRNGSGSSSNVAKAILMAIDFKPDIISMSLGASRPSKDIEEAVIKAYEQNIPIVCSAGNSGYAGVSYPAAYPETISVAAFDKNGQIADFSSRGKEVDWAAPGHRIFSTFLNNAYASLSGTSMACPYLVGIIALMLSKHKQKEKETGLNDGKTVEEIRGHLLRYTLDKGEKGKDKNWGHGVVDIEKLLKEEFPEEKKPEPDIPHPYPDPEPEEPTPEEPLPEEPKPSKPESWLRKNVAWVVLGVFVVSALALYVFSLLDFSSPEEIDWDSRFQEQMKLK